MNKLNKQKILINIGIWQKYKWPVNTNHRALWKSVGCTQVLQLESLRPPKRSNVSFDIMKHLTCHLFKIKFQSNSHKTRKSQDIYISISYTRQHSVLYIMRIQLHTIRSASAEDKYASQGCWCNYTRKLFQARSVRLYWSETHQHDNILTMTSVACWLYRYSIMFKTFAMLV